MDYSKDELVKLDNVLKFLNNNKNVLFENQYLANYFEIPLYQFEFLYNKICNFSLNEFNIGNILNKDSNYQKIECDYNTDRFIENGGFKEYYKLKRQKELENKNPNVIAKNYIGGDNYGIQSSKSDFTAPITINAKQKPSINPEIKSSVQNFFSNPWVLLISGIAIEEITLGKIYKFIISII